MNLPVRVIVIALAASLFFSCWMLLIEPRQQPIYSLPPVTGQSAPGARMDTFWVSNGETNEVHSANIVVAGGIPISVWYGGTEEGHQDVAIFISRFEGEAWTPAQQVVDRQLTEEALGRFIRKVGNPALHVWPDGRLGLFYVSVSIGGWAASAVNYMESSDQGRTWRPPVRLVTSPFLNISTLVRTGSLSFQDGTIQLPVYHEFLGKFAEALQLSDEPAVLDKVRLSRGKHSLQPAVANTDGASAMALLRYSGSPPNRLLESSTADGGRHWSVPVTTRLPNPDSAVALLNLGDGTMLLALNDLEDGRHRLSLAMQLDGEWSIVRVLEEEVSRDPTWEFDFSYPSLASGGNGDIHLVYTWNQKRIKHLRFNREWLESAG